MTRDDFEYDDVMECYNITVTGIELEIDETAMCDDIVVMAEKIISDYRSKINDIAKFCISDESFCDIYPYENEVSIRKKLGKPFIRMYSENNVLSYCEHRLDDVHIIDIEFEGVFEKFLSISIDG